MQRCIQLALAGAGNVAPNPMVGAVLVHSNRIIGEGYHQEYGEAHAEVNCINSVKAQDNHLIPESTLYVSLEPCAHYGKTPPCTNLIINQKIKKVIIGCADVFAKVNGKGIELLRAAGIEVEVGVLHDECIQLNKRFFTFHSKQRPYIILKWAQTKNGFLAAKNDERLLISNDATNRLVHKWRSAEAAILVGYNTALKDDPQLNSRLYNNKNALRLVIDKQLQLPETLHVFDGLQKTVVFNYIKNDEQQNTAYYKIDEQQNTLTQITNYCYNAGLQSILVEGGANTLQQFISAGLWDEARIITNEQLTIQNGLVAPTLTNAALQRTGNLLTDMIAYYKHD